MWNVTLEQNNLYCHHTTSCYNKITVLGLIAPRDVIVRISVLKKDDKKQYIKINIISMQKKKKILCLVQGFCSCFAAKQERKIGPNVQIC